VFNQLISLKLMEFLKICEFSMSKWTFSITEVLIILEFAKENPGYIENIFDEKFFRDFTAPV
jgi:hypothetical protein